MAIRVLGRDDLRRALPMADTIAAMKRAFAAFSSGEAVSPQRLAVPVADQNAVTLVKPALLSGEGLGAKLVSVFPNNPARGKPVITGVVLLLDPTTGEVAALCDGTFLTAWRTGAASGAATDLLARRDARVGAVIGCGVQGRTQALAIDTVRELEIIRAFDLDRQRAEELAAEMSAALSAAVEVCGSAREAVEQADVICTATTSSEPVLDGSWLTDGVHVNGVGSFTREMREVDLGTVERARVVVDSREAAMIEAGELIHAVEAGATAADQWAELGEVVSGQAPGRRSRRELTFFKSVGLAVQDIAAAALALERAVELGLGFELELS